MPKAPDNYRDFASLLDVVKSLRGPDGCPWDREQTHKSLTKYTLEEAHELVEALDSGEQKEMISELGDLLFQVVLHSEIARQEGRFDIYDVLEVLCEKMVRRHPHVFSSTEVSGTEEVMQNWGEIKAKEKQGQPEKKNFGVPKGMPALLRSEKIGGKTKKLKFDWSDVKDVVAKVEEELGELKEAIASNDKAEQQHELGDLLFSCAQLGRHLDVNPEQALRETNNRFENRFFQMKDKIESDGKAMTELTTDELEAAWQEVKRKLKASEKN